MLVYPVSFLAQQMGRSTDTIRLWERDGVIPSSYIRAQNGWRYYTRAEIDILVRVAGEEGIRQGRSHKYTNFSKRVTEELDNYWEQQQKEYSDGGK